jgi:putative peptidoglycan lipid II flippase
MGKRGERLSTTVKKVTNATVILMTFTIISKLAGFFRDSLTAKHFGTGMEKEAYVMARTIPVEIFLVLAASIGTAFIPIFNTVLKNKGEKLAQDFANNILTISVIICSVISILLIFFAPTIIPLIAKGYTDEKLALTIMLAKILFPLIILIILNQLISSICYSLETFVGPAIAPLFNNILLVIYLFFFVDRFGINGLTVITVAGFFIQVFTLLIASGRKGYQLQFRLNLRDKNIPKLLNLLWPVLIGSSLQWIVIILNKSFGSELGENIVSSLDYAFILHTFSVGVFSASIALVVYPYFSKFVAVNDVNNLKSTLKTSLNVVFLILVPVSIGVIVLRTEIIELVFERGKFTSDDTKIVSTILLFYTFGLLALSLREILIRVFYSYKDAITAVKNGMIGAAANIILILLLIKTMNYKAIPLAISISYLITLFLLGWRLHKKISGYDIGKILLTGAKTIFSGIIMGIVVWFINKSTGLSDSPSIINKALNLIVCISSGVIVYFTSCFILKVKELDFGINYIKAKTHK